MGTRIVLPVFFFVLCVGAEENPCASCHDQAKKIVGTVHSDLGCASCHEKHEVYPHPAGVAKPECATCHDRIAAQHAESVHGQKIKAGDESAPRCAGCHGNAHEVVKANSAAFRQAEPETCGTCHSEVAVQFKTSVHGKLAATGDVNAPVCTSCHGEHLIIAKSDKTSPVAGRNLRDTCGRCHANVQLARRFGIPIDRITSFDASFHGLAAKSGSQTVANCASCHGVHNILPSSDAKSTVNPANLPTTCGNCHPGAGQRFAIGQVHQTEAGGEPTGVIWVRRFYLWVIPLTLGLMFLHNAGDLVRKLRRIYREGRPARAPAGQGAIRMLAAERIQHAALALSFFVLAWTGFALQYPEQWWARPLLVWENGWPVRRNIHRIASVVFMAVTLAHILSLILNRLLRRHWLELAPRLGDVKEGLANFGYNLGLVRERPGRSAHSYVEKAEYWAVAWGSAVMIATGALLWANAWVLAWLPKYVLDIATSIHWYEAVLAAAAIVVWHLYSVIFDPDVYPVDTAFLTGRSGRRSVGQESVGQEKGPQDSGDK